MDTEPKKSKSLELTFGLIIILGVIAIVVLRIDARQRKANQAEAFSNVRSFSLALYQFEIDYGSYPNDATVSDVTKSFPAHGYDLTGKSSNAAFRQLLAAGIVPTEHPFYAKIKGSIKPDGNILPKQALKKGEVGFAYISGLSTAGNPSTPLVLTPLIPGTTKFDSKPFKGKAIILHIDSSVRTYDIHEDGNIYDKGINILSPEHPIWKGKAPDIRYPE
jgi:type II secretory pathway pseudopilin PulG